MKNSSKNYKKDNCQGCNTVFGKNDTQYLVASDSSKNFFVDKTCHDRIVSADKKGWQPAKGPKLYLLKFDPKENRK